MIVRRSLAAICVVLCSLPLGAGSCGPSPYGRPELEEGDLYVKSVQLLTEQGGRPDVGPDGRVVFDRRADGGDRDDRYDIWVMDHDTPDDARCVTCDVSGLPVGDHGTPAWHPSGEWILFQAAIKVGLTTHPGSGVASELWVIRPDGSQPTELFHIEHENDMDGALHPHFDKAGERIVFARLRAPGDLFDTHLSMGRWDVMVGDFDAASPGLMQWRTVITEGTCGLPPGIFETHGFSPDGTKILLQGSDDPEQPATAGDVLLIDIETGCIAEKVTDSPEVWDEHAHFHPDDTRIVYSSGEELGQPADVNALNSKAEWWVREPSGRHHRLTFFTTSDWEWKSLEAVGSGDGLEVSASVFAADGAFTPDGRYYVGLLLRRDRYGEWLVRVELDEYQEETSAEE